MCFVSGKGLQAARQQRTWSASAGFSRISPPQTTTAGQHAGLHELQVMPQTHPYTADHALALVACDQYPAVIRGL